MSESFCESCFLLLDVVSYNLFNTSECCTLCMINVYTCTYKGVTCYTNIVIRAHLFPMLDCLAPMIGSTTKPQETWNQVIDVMMWHHEVLGWYSMRLCHVIPYQALSYHIMRDSYEKHTRTEHTTVESTPRSIASVKLSPKSSQQSQNIPQIIPISQYHLSFCIHFCTSFSPRRAGGCGSISYG